MDRLRDAYRDIVQASTTGRRTTRALYTEPPPVTIAILPARL